MKILAAFVLSLGAVAQQPPPTVTGAAAGQLCTAAAPCITIWTGKSYIYAKLGPGLTLASNVITAAGSPGPQGPAGPAGQIGPAGLPGPAGQIGAVGPAGPQGQTGPQGIPGVAGAAGSQGPAGAQGPPGGTGATGPAGPPSNNQTDGFTINCVQTQNCTAGTPSVSFTASQTPNGAVDVYRNGARQYPTVDYTVNNATVTFPGCLAAGRWRSHCARLRDHGARRHHAGAKCLRRLWHWLGLQRPAADPDRAERLHCGRCHATTARASDVSRRQRVLAASMKPRLFKRDGQWFLRFGYQPRMFALFGSTGAERQAIIERHVQEGKVESWSDGLACLRELYRRREVRL